MYGLNLKGAVAHRFSRKCNSPFWVVEKTPPVAYGDSPLWDGAFGITVNFPAKAQSFRVRQRLPPRGSWQNRQVLTEGVRSKPLP